MLTLPSTEQNINLQKQKSAKALQIKIRSKLNKKFCLACNLLFIFKFHWLTFCKACSNEVRSVIPRITYFESEKNSTEASILCFLIYFKASIGAVNSI